MSEILDHEWLKEESKLRGMIGELKSPKKIKRKKISVK